MNALELNAIAEGIFKYIQAQAEDLRDGVAIVGMVLLNVFNSAKREGTTIETFMEDFKLSAIASYKDVSAEGTRTRQ